MIPETLQKIMKTDGVVAIATLGVDGPHLVNTWNTAIIEQRYKTLNGEITVFHKPAVGHHPHGLDDPKPLVDLILHYTKAVVQ